MADMPTYHRGFVLIRAGEWEETERNSVRHFVHKCLEMLGLIFGKQESRCHAPEDYQSAELNSTGDIREHNNGQRKVWIPENAQA